MSALPGSFLVTIKPGITNGAEIVALLRAEAKLAGTNASRMSLAVFGSLSRWATLEKTVGPVRDATVAHVIAWLESLEKRNELEGLDALREAVPVRAGESARGKPVKVGDSLPSSASPLSAAVLVAEVDAFLASSGMREFEFAQRCLSWRSLTPLRTAVAVRGETAKKVRSFIAKKPAPCRPSEVPPNSAVASARMRDAAEDKHLELGQRRNLTELAHETRAGGETIADRVRRLSAELEQEERTETEADREERVARELIEIADPSALIRRAQRDWPDQAATVRRFAIDEGIKVGEAWHRVIVAGLDALTRGGA